VQPNRVKHLDKTQLQTKERVTAVPFVVESFEIVRVVTSVFVAVAGKLVSSVVVMSVFGSGDDVVDAY